MLPLLGKTFLEDNVLQLRTPFTLWILNLTTCNNEWFLLNWIFPWIFFKIRVTLFIFIIYQTHTLFFRQIKFSKHCSEFQIKFWVMTLWQQLWQQCWNPIFVYLLLRQSLHTWLKSKDVYVQYFHNISIVRLFIHIKAAIEVGMSLKAVVHSCRH